MDEAMGQLIKTPREENWQTGNTFAGPLRNLLDRDVENTAQERRCYDMCVCPPCSCSGTLSMINKTVILFNSPPGCGEEGMISWRTFHMQSWQQMGLKSQPEWYTTVVVHNNMGQKEIVFGGGDNMHRSVHCAYERYKPKMIVILNTCPPAIIGDDLEGVGTLLKKEFKDRCHIIPIRSEGISTPIWSNAWDLSLISLMDNVMKPPERRVSNKINIFSNFTYFYDDWQELARMVRAIGLEPSGRFGSLPGYSEVEDIENMADAACNAAVCSNYARSAFDRMEKEYGIPFVEFPSQAMGIEMSEEWLTAVASVFGLEKKAASFIGREKDQLRGSIKDFASGLKGKRILVSGGIARAIPNAFMCHHLGMEIAAINLFHYDHRNDRELEKLADLIGGDVPVLVGMQLYEDMQLLRELKPDIYLVDPHYAGIGARMGVPTVSNHFSNRGSYVGFRGAFNLAKSLAMALARKDFFAKFSGLGECKYRGTEFFPWNEPYYGMLKSGVYHGGKRRCGC